MPELRSGARRSKRLGDLQPATQPANQEENFLAPAQNRTTRRRGRGRGNAAAAVAKGPSAAGRGRGVRLIDLDPEPAVEALPRIVSNKTPRIPRSSAEDEVPLLQKSFV